MNRLFSFVIILFVVIPVLADEQIPKEKKNKFSISTELTSKYVWRGQEYGKSPVIFGTLGYDYKGLNVFATGAYAMQGEHSEVDFGLSYTIKWFTLGFSDYYYPTSAGEKDNYLNYKSHETGHSVESYMTIAPEKVPLWLTLSAYLYGADKRLDGQQAYSSYLELGYSHQFKGNHTLSLLAGACLNKSFYTQYQSGFNVVNIACKYATAIPLGRFQLPVSGTLSYNPYVNKPFLSLSIYLSTK